MPRPLRTKKPPSRPNAMAKTTTTTTKITAIQCTTNPTTTTTTTTTPITRKARFNTRSATVAASSPMPSSPGVLTPSISKVNRIMSTRTSSRTPSILSDLKKVADKGKKGKKVIISVDEETKEDEKDGGPKTPTKPVTTIFETPKRSQPRRSLKGRAGTPFRRVETAETLDDGEEGGERVLVPDSLASSPSGYYDRDLEIEGSPLGNDDLVLGVDEVLAHSTPMVTSLASKEKGKKRSSGDAFGFEEAMKVSGSEDAKRRRAITWDWEADDEGGRFSLDPESPVTEMKKFDKGKGKAMQVEDDDDSSSMIDFNYSSSSGDEAEIQVQATAETVEIPDSSSEAEDEEDIIDENENENNNNEDDDDGEVIESSLPKKKGQPSTAALQSLMPRRRQDRTRKTRKKPAASAAAAVAPKRRKESSRKVLKDVTRAVVPADDLLDDLDNPRLEEVDDDSIGDTIYVDPGASISSPPESPVQSTSAAAAAAATTSTSKTTTAKSKTTKAKRNAKSAPPTTIRKSKNIVNTYSSRSHRREDSASSDKENHSPSSSSSSSPLADVSSESFIAGGINDTTFADYTSGAANTSLSDGPAANTPAGKENFKQIQEKFKKIDEWEMDFEEVTGSSSDGPVKGGR